MIYELSKALARFGYHQVKNIGRLFLGYPLTTPSLGSVTLDHDDLLIAKSQLKNREDWFNPDIVKEYENAIVPKLSWTL